MSYIGIISQKIFGKHSKDYSTAIITAQCNPRHVGGVFESDITVYNEFGDKVHTDTMRYDIEPAISQSLQALSNARLKVISMASELEARYISEGKIVNNTVKFISDW